MRGFVLGAVLLAGCGECHKYDPATVSALQTTIDNAQADHRFVMDVLRTTTANAQLVDEVEYLHLSEIDRLKGWLWREGQKSHE